MGSSDRRLLPGAKVGGEPEQGVTISRSGRGWTGSLHRRAPWSGARARPAPRRGCRAGRSPTPQHDAGAKRAALSPAVAPAARGRHAVAPAGGPGQQRRAAPSDLLHDALAATAPLAAQEPRPSSPLGQLLLEERVRGEADRGRERVAAEAAPWVPGLNAEATSSVASVAPIGIPLASAGHHPSGVTPGARPPRARRSAPSRSGSSLSGGCGLVARLTETGGSRRRARSRRPRPAPARRGSPRSCCRSRAPPRAGRCTGRT